MAKTFTSALLPDMAAKAGLGSSQAASAGVQLLLMDDPQATYTWAADYTSDIHARDDSLE